jgi:hypothetical protein
MTLLRDEFSVDLSQPSVGLTIYGDLPAGFIGQPVDGGYRCSLDHHNAQAMRRWQPWTAPQRLSASRSLGLGDRLGLATLGHIQAVSHSDFFPLLAQQSIREMQRAGRSAQTVMDDVTWAAAAARYDRGFASDADHVKTVQDIDACIEAEFLGFTVDPSQYVDDTAETLDHVELRAHYRQLPWDQLQTTPEAALARFAPHGDSDDVMRAAVKYGRAVAHIYDLHAHLAQRLGPDGFDLEVSIDETATATTPLQHRYVATELLRLEVSFQTLAPRFVGQFLKGVDYVGSIPAFEQDYAAHAAVAHELGYRLSIHSGSDKFSIYPIIARSGAFHLKTAGTSWLEALRVIANVEPPLFRQMLALAIEQYDQARQTYHVSGEVARIPTLRDAELGALLDQWDARQVLHVAFGAILAQYKAALYETLRHHLSDYTQTIAAHFERHIAVLAKITG